MTTRKRSGRKLSETAHVREPASVEPETGSDMPLSGDLQTSYVEGIVNLGIVEATRMRINRIDTDAIIDSGYIEEFIEDNPYSPFPQIQNTERPDVVASMLVEGKVAILVNGSP